jgi:hypothetical protein
MVSIRIGKPEPVYTHTREQEIWNYIGDFENETLFCYEFIKKRIKERKSLKRTNRILKIKKQSQNKDATIFKPIRYHREEPIKIRLNGLFPIFHDCYSDDLSIYLEGYEFKLENLIDAGEINYMKLSDLLGQSRLNENKIVNEEAQKPVQLLELDREFIFIFALSTLARYRVNDWIEIISGRKSDLILKIRRYLQAVELLFPNLVLNELFEGVYLFYEPAKVGSPVG